MLLLLLLLTGLRLQRLHGLLRLPGLLELLQVELHLVQGRRGARLFVVLQQHLRRLRGEQALGRERGRGERPLVQRLGGLQDLGGELVLRRRHRLRLQLLLQGGLLLRLLLRRCWLLLGRFGMEGRRLVTGSRRLLRHGAVQSCRRSRRKQHTRLMQCWRHDATTSQDIRCS